MNRRSKNLKEITSSQLLFEEAQRLGLKPSWETNYGLFSVEIDNSRRFFFHTNLNLNGEKSRILTKNKHFTRLILGQAGFNNIPFCLPASRLKLEEFFSQHQPIICKPLLGQQSKDIQLISTKQQMAECSLHRTFFENFIKGVEYRSLVLEGEVIAMQKKELKPTKKNQWQLRYIGLTQDEWLPQLADEAIKIASLFKLRWTGIDFIAEDNGKAWVLEINSAPGIVKIHYPDEGESVNAAKKIWSAVL